MKLDKSRITNVVMDSVHGWDYPDFADAYVASADYDGRPMTDEELDALNADSDYVNEQAHESTH
jgi:hypothetical protein